mgnify:CR=1 FL=1
MAVSRGPFGYVPAVTRPTSRIAALASVPLLAMALAVSSPALAQTSSQSGVWIDAQPGLGLGGSPFGPSFGTRASVGYWKGNYDFDYLLGRAWGVGLATRVDLFGPELRVAPSLEIRRMIDLLVLGFRWRVLAGPEWENDKLGVGLRVGGTVKVRPTPRIGPTIDLEAGAAWVDGRISPRIGVSIGVEIALSVQGREDRDPKSESNP